MDENKNFLFYFIIWSFGSFLAAACCWYFFKPECWHVCAGFASFFIAFACAVDVIATKLINKK